MLISEKSKRNKKVRHLEYYNLTNELDNLYAKSKLRQNFYNLIPLILSYQNIILAYRNIKSNGGSSTKGVDNLTIENIKDLSNENVVEIVRKKLSYYKPKPVRRVEIPKPNGKMRPLGIPTIWDRLIQQCILQILEPIAEAKFIDKNNGFRPNRSAENAVAQCGRMINFSKLYYVVDIDIKGFFDNVNHGKLIKQLWAMGIRDKTLITIISVMLKCPIKMLNGEIIYPTKGTPQGGILSPLLANIVLNELDWWITSQWEEMKTCTNYTNRIHKNGSKDHSNTYRVLRTTKLKEMHIVRYADDFKIFCRNYKDAKRAFIGTKEWLKDRLKLEISEEKSKIISLKENYSEFLGFKIKAMKRGLKYVVKSHVLDKAIAKTANKLIGYIKEMRVPKGKTQLHTLVNKYNITVMGVHNYYGIATKVCEDFSPLANRIGIILHNRLKKIVSSTGTIESCYIKKRYGASKQMRYISKLPLVPIGYVKCKFPMEKSPKVNKYTKSGRAEMQKPIDWIDTKILKHIMLNPVRGKSVEYNDNRVSLFSAQKGKCNILNTQLQIDNLDCHHKIPKALGGDDSYNNLVLLNSDVHKLVHAIKRETIDNYVELLGLDIKQLQKINKLRNLAKLENI